MTRKPRAAFFGTPEFAVDSLRALAQQCELVCVFSQPDRRSGRGMKTRPTPVKRAAQELGLPVEQPSKVKTTAFRERIAALEIDFALVVAFGRILPLPLLETPRLGFVNVHASLLPRWRGAAPIQRAIMAGDEFTGVCLMQMDEGMDTGDVLAVREAPIRSDDTAGSLSERLAIVGATLVAEEILPFANGKLEPTPQPDAGATHAAKIEKHEGNVAWDEPAEVADRRIRGVSPSPGAFSFLDQPGQSEPIRVKVHRARIESQVVEGISGRPGQVRAVGGRLWVGCAQGALELLEVQAPGRKRVRAAEFVQGYQDFEGARFRLPDEAP